MEEVMSLLADQASSNLPAQVEALTKAHKEQSAATAALQVSLTKLENELEIAKKNNQTLVNRRNELITKTCVNESERDKTRQRVDQLDKELSRTIDDYEQLKLDIELLEEDTKELEKTTRACCERMDAYKRSAEKIYQCLPEMKELESSQNKLKDLGEKRASLQKELNFLSGSTEDQCDFEEAMTDIRRDLKELESVVEAKKLLIEKARSEVTVRQQEKQRLETANMILKKRNSALLIRRKRQAESQRQKFERLTNHLERTANMLATSKARLQEISGQ